MNEIERLIEEILELQRQIECKKKLLIKLQSEKLNITLQRVKRTH